MYWFSKLKWSIAFLWKLLFGGKLYDPVMHQRKMFETHPAWSVSDTKGLRIRKIQWWMGNVIIKEDYIIGTYFQIRNKLDFIPPEDVVSYFGTGFTLASKDIYQFDILNWKCRKVKLTGTWFEPLEKWFKPGERFWKRGTVSEYNWESFLERVN